MRTRQEGAESLPGKTCVIVKIATTGCDRAEDELLELTLLDARTRLDTPVMPPPLYFGRFRPRKHRDWPEAGAATASRRLMCRTRRSRRGSPGTRARPARAGRHRRSGRVQSSLHAGFSGPFLPSFPVSQMSRYHGRLVALRRGNGAGQPSHVARHGRSLPHRAGEGACLADGRRD